MTEFASWIKRIGPETANSAGSAKGAALVFPHAGGAAAAKIRLGGCAAGPPSRSEGGRPTRSAGGFTYS